MTKTTIDLPFTPEDVREGRVREDAEKKRLEDLRAQAWDRVIASGDLAPVRRKLSIDELAKLIRTIVQ